MGGKILRGVDSYDIPREVYYQCLWLARDAVRLEELAANANRSSIGKASANRLDAINRAKEAVPEEYREAVMGNIIYGTKFPDFAHDNTWRKWKKRYIYQLAVELELI